ncbi:MAG TPA: EAL domain-containing protein [Solirubrobacteraceae bacterium]
MHEPVRILLIERDPRAAMLIGAMLRATWDEDLRLSHAEQLPDDVLEGDPECVLIGLGPAGAERLDSLERLRRLAPEVAIVVLTETADEGVALSAIQAGAQDSLVTSDLNPARLRRAVRHSVQRKCAEARLAHQALHDELTGLPNRALFVDRLRVALDRSRRTPATVAVLFLDLDHFKEINDTLGHDAGDRVLAELAERLRAMLRPMDTVARFGGDEFTLLFEDLEGEREAVLIAERLSDAAARPVRLPEGTATVAASIGIALVSDPSVAAETVIREADAAMYRAKQVGGARFELYDETSRQRASDRLELESELSRALERDELRVHYQPSVALDGEDDVLGFEALVRWQHPERGLIGPGDFIPLAEETGMVIPIGHFVLEQAVRQIVSWRREWPELTVSVNLSPRQLEDTALADAVTAMLDGSGSSADALVLEIPDRALAGDAKRTVPALMALKRTGVSIVIDDYGTASSPLSDLRRLPVDAIKLHESFVWTLDSDPAESTVVGALVELGHGLGLGVTAEGVETEVQLERLRALGCDSAQGYLFSPAVPGEQAHALLTTA